jgi:hypothetical protein
VESVGKLQNQQQVENSISAKRQHVLRQNNFLPVSVQQLISLSYKHTGRTAYKVAIHARVSRLAPRVNPRDASVKFN